MRYPSLLLGLCAAALLASPAHAQRGNGSDITGPVTTSGDIAGGAFVPAAGTVAADASPAIGAAVAAAAFELSASLGEGSLTATSPSGASVTIPAAVQAAVLSVLTGTGASAEFSAAVDASGSAASGELVQALQGLLSSPATGQLAEAIGFFNAVVGDASPAFMANPPAEFMAIHSVLTTLTAAAQAAG